MARSPLTMSDMKCLVLAILLLAPAARAASDANTRIQWQDWRHDLFAQAQRQHRFVLLDLEAVWCHWCHVMDHKTYGNPEVARLIHSDYIPVKVDQDAHPALSNRYGNWGWPATIVFAPDGSEIVKRRGYIPPVNMISMLQAIIDDPSPGPSVLPATEVKPAPHAALKPAQRERMEAIFYQAYDPDYGGWGDLHKFIPAAAMAYALERARQDKPLYTLMARQTLTAAQNLIDPVWGGVYQYSDEDDWRSPHFEKLMSFQAEYLRLYAHAYALWQQPAYLDTARAIHQYLTDFLLSAAGAFYASQDADLNQRIDGHTYYALAGPARRKLGIPRIDEHIYARENGWAIRALAEFYGFTGNDQALAQARTAADYILAHRRLPGGGFSHGAHDPAGPFLGDTLAMGQAMLSLHRVTGERRWLRLTAQALDFIEQYFRDARGGFMTSVQTTGSEGVFQQPVRLVKENVALARLANRVFHYTGDGDYRDLAEHAMHYPASADILRSGGFLPGVLLADRELTRDPVHITVIGPKANQAAQALYRRALRYPAGYARLEWWDRQEGALPHADIDYPELDRPAAFACSNQTCSLPVFCPRQDRRGGRAAQ